MKKVALFGTGVVGKKVLEILTDDTVAFFIDNHRKEYEINGVAVLSFEEFLLQKDEVVVHIASTDYAQEMTAQLKDYNIEHYFVWDWELVESFYSFSRYNPIYSGDDWSWKPYSLIRSFYKFDFMQYRSIAIYTYPEMAEVLMRLLEGIGKAGEVVCVMRANEAAEKTLDLIKGHIDCMLCAVRREDNEICDIYEHTAGIDTIDLFDIARFLPQYHSPGARKFKDKYKGQRCFIIGNGPSLRAEDLQKLHENHEITFACNKIYNIFDQTDWRPDFYFIFDVWLLKSAMKGILNVVPKICSFYNYAFCNGTIMLIDSEEIIPIYNMPEQPTVNCMPRFSKDISTYHSNGGTVSYTMLQAAYYMGFSEVYLLGLDHYQMSLKEAGKINHFYDESKENVYEILPEYVKENTHIQQFNAHLSARYAFEEDNRKILNATRGGYLEAYERCDFDSLF